MVVGYRDIASAVDGAMVVKAIIALGVVYAMCSWTAWAVREVASFFMDGRERRAEWLDSAEQIGAAYEAAEDARARGDMEAAWIHDMEAENATRRAREQRG